MTESGMNRPIFFLRLFENEMKNLMKQIFCSLSKNQLGLPNVCTITNERLMMNVNNELKLHLSKIFCAKKQVRGWKAHRFRIHRFQTDANKNYHENCVRFHKNKCSTNSQTSSQWNVILLILMNMRSEFLNNL